MPAPRASWSATAATTRSSRPSWRAGSGTEAALSFPTGFAANLGVLATLADAPDVLIVSDELNHASIVDGCRLARARWRSRATPTRATCDELLAAHAGPAVVVTDSVFSMDGDEAPVDDLLAVCARHGACLVLDEAHAVLGPAVDLADAADARRRGRAGRHDVEGARVGRRVRRRPPGGGRPARQHGPPVHLHHRHHSADVAGALAALRIVRGERRAPRCGSGCARHIDAVARPPVADRARRARRRASRAARRRPRCSRQGLLVPAIRPPTVAVGTSRLRVALSAAHTDDQVERLVRALADLPAPPAR